MDERSDNEQPINAAPGRGALARACAERMRFAIDDASWLVRRRIAWPAEDAVERLGTRGLIGVFGGGGIAVAGVVVALIVASPGGSGSAAGTTEAFVPPPRPTPAAVVTPAREPKRTAKPSGPTLHGAPPSFAPAEDVRSGVADGKALDRKRVGTGEAPARRGATSAADSASSAGGQAGAGDAPAATAKIGSTPEASALATSQAGALDRAQAASVPGSADAGAKADGLATSPAPRAAKQVARHFAEAFVAYEVGGVDSQVRETFGATGTKQLSKSLLKRPPRQPDSVKVPRAKVVNVVAGPSAGKVYSVSVSLLRLGVTSELRLQMEQGVGKKWQVTDVLG